MRRSDPAGHGLAVYACLLSAKIPVGVSVISRACEIDSATVIGDLYDLVARGWAKSHCLAGGGVLYTAIEVPLESIGD